MTKSRLDKLHRQLTMFNPDDEVGVHSEGDFIKLLDVDELTDLLDIWEEYYEQRGKHN